MASAPGPPSNDKTVNKVALCSAIFAGFAYVGYSVVRTAFHRRRREGDVSYPEGEARLFFRRLSQTTQTDALLGNLDLSASGRIILRPLSVQERIRELNFRARHFADTMLALQGKTLSSSVGGGGGPRSLQCSPWSSPRILSPVDVRQFIASRSSDNLSLVPVNSSSAPSPAHRRRFSSSTKKSLLMKKQGPDIIVGSEEADKAIADISEELKEKLENLSLKGRAMDPYEAKTLVALLYASDEGILERTLITMANLATFEINQNNLRDAGCLPRLLNLLCHPKSEIRLATVRCIGNMSLNEHNQREMKMFIPMLFTFINDGGGGGGEGGGAAGAAGDLTLTSLTLVENSVEEMCEAVLTTLSNLAVLSNWHLEYTPFLPPLFRLLDKDSLPVQLQTLKLLVNLSTSCDVSLIGALLASPTPSRFLYMLSSEAHVEVVLRLLTFIANLVNASKACHFNPATQLPVQDKAPYPDTLYAALFGPTGLEKLKEKAEQLLATHPDEDVRIQARRVHSAMVKAAM